MSGHPASAEAQEVFAMGDSCYKDAMTETESIVIEHLRHMRGALDGVRDDIREIKGRLGTLESQYANISNRMDRLDGRVERIERRLNLAEV